MISIDINTHGLEKKLNSFSVATVFRPAMRKSVLLLESKMKPYPPAPSGSKYRRTGTLGRRWTTKVDVYTDGLIGKVGNNTEYAPQVQSKAFQKDIHKGRWQTDEDVLEKSISSIQRLFENAASDFLGG